MVNKREYGIVFAKDANCGIAQITVYDQTIGKYISENGVESSSAAYRYVDTYQAASPTYSTGESFYCYWISLVAGHNYTINVVNSGTHNTLASPPYNIAINKFLDSEPLIVDDLVQKQLTMYHADYPLAQYIYTPENKVTLDAYITQTFNGDGSTRLFSLSGNNHAATFFQFSIDSGATWRYPSDLYITWGGNTTHDNETMDANDQFSIYFIDEAPPAGTNNVIIKFKPKVNKAILQLTVKQPHDELNAYKDYKSHVVMQDYALEFIP